MLAIDAGPGESCKQLNVTWNCLQPLVERFKHFTMSMALLGQSLKPSSIDMQGSLHEHDARASPAVHQLFNRHPPLRAGPKVSVLHRMQSCFTMTLRGRT